MPLTIENIYPFEKKKMNEVWKRTCTERISVQKNKDDKRKNFISLKLIHISSDNIFQFLIGNKFPYGSRTRALFYFKLQPKVLLSK